MWMRLLQLCGDNSRASFDIDYLLSQYVHIDISAKRGEEVSSPPGRSLSLLGRDLDGGEVPGLSAIRGGHGSAGGAERPAAGVLEALVGLVEHDRDILPACFGSC